MNIYSNFLSKEELKRAADSIPLNQDVMLTVEQFGYKTVFRKGRLYNKREHGPWAYSFYWTDGKYMEYVWLRPKFDFDDRKIHTVEILK